MPSADFCPAVRRPLDPLRREPDVAGAFTVSPAELLACPAHCHLNTTIVSRAFYFEIAGLDEGLRYECDRDFYLRAIRSPRNRGSAAPGRIAAQPRTRQSGFVLA